MLLPSYDDDGGGEFYVQGDTVVNGIQYHKVYYADEYIYKNVYRRYEKGLSALMREDTNSGKLWMMVIPKRDGMHEFDDEFLVCDMSLRVGDTFFAHPAMSRLALSYDDVYIVDEIRYSLSGKKKIYLRPKNDFKMWINFVGGTGSSEMFFLPVDLYSSRPIILQAHTICHYKDDIMAYQCFWEEGWYSSAVDCVLHLTGVDEAVPPSGIKVFPNPCSNVLHIASEKEMIRCNVYDIVGRKVLIIDRPTTEIDISALPSGQYLIETFDQDNKRNTSIFQTIKP